MSRLAIACVTLMVTSTIAQRCELHNDTRSAERMAYHGKYAMFAPGVDADRMVMASVDYESNAGNFSCSITVRFANGTSNQCHLNFSRNANANVWQLTMQQLTENRLVVQWRDGRVKGIAKTALISTDNCQTLKIVERRFNPRGPPNREVVGYEVGFDELFDVAPCPDGKLCYQSYDIDGNKICDYRKLPIQGSRDQQLIAVSKKKRSDGFYSYNNVQTNGVSLIDDDKVERIMNVSTENLYAHAVDGQSLAVCGYLEDDTSVVECQQHDLNTGKVTLSQRLPRSYNIVDIRGLKAGGVVIFGMTHGKKHLLVVVEIRPDQPVLCQEHELPLSNEANMGVTNFDEQLETFTFAIHTLDTLGGGATNHLIFYKSMLPSKLQKV